MNTLFILGNGFDLDLGLKTSYRDFFDSKFYPAAQGEFGLISYLKNRYEIQNWIDLEKEIKEFCLNSFSITQYKNLDSRIGGASQREELKNRGLLYSSHGLHDEFESLRKGLQDYLISVTKHFEINKQSYAGKIASLANLIAARNETSIITFNYTPLTHICKNFFTNETTLTVDHIHGTLKDENIVIGFDGKIDIDEEKCFMIKSHSPHYRSHNVRSKLAKAESVIIFGLSLGEIDYHYFENFFKDQSGENPSIELRKKYITIFTYDDKERYKILNNLRNMNNKRNEELYDLNDLKIFCTKNDMDYKKIEDFFQDWTNNMEQYSDYDYIVM